MTARALGTLRLLLAVGVLVCVAASAMRAQHDGVTLLGLILGAGLCVAMRARPRPRAHRAP